MNGIRTRLAKKARARIIERFGMDRSASFVDAARMLIESDNLYVKVPQTRAEALAFLDHYQLLVDFNRREPAPLTKSVTRESRGL